ncbi:pyridoxamine 5'-phosphate oxidase family protein [Nocardia sp. NPDC051463]|uniref:pyridoxamine 5'-phosphate oxidase family protein n=1 Tax=Nocardia sp. NPDC051463 TaxID=3154845 RepID=UPI00342977F4
MTISVKSFHEIRDEFEAYIGDIVYATMVTVDSKGRPRSRVLIPVWEIVDGNPVGWLATYRTPVKEAHLAANPHTSFAYWTRKQNQVHADALADWVPLDDLVTRRHVWDLYEQTSPKGAGYPLGNFWQDIDDPKLHILRLSPWRIQVVRGRDLRSKMWKAVAES